MSGPGMWMPKQKDGKNWIVKYVIRLNGEYHHESRKFRVRADGYDFITTSKATLEANSEVDYFKFMVPKKIGQG
jgi:hypothetical protein